MHPETIKNKGRGRLFKNELLEGLSRVNPLVIYSIYFPVIIGLLIYGYREKGLSLLTESWLFLVGLLSWSLFEYIAHRFLFHLHATGPRAQRFVYMMHGIHHEYPRDKGRLFMPVIPSITLATIIFFATRLLMGWSSLAFFPGFLFGYLCYGSMHYAMHAFAPPGFLKALWRNHALHHYGAPDKGYGVSSVLWDIIFGTVPKLEK
jgi:4-hydroxysphinganine ceramide fatty acyl 2-hydroxylase